MKRKASVMAGDWIKTEKATARKPEILRIACALQVHPDHAFGLCIRFWSWCDDHLQTGNVAGVTTALVDALLDRSGFCDALISVGWLRVREGSLEIPNFDRHLSESAKNRALTAQRVAKCKKKKANDEVTVNALPEKRREEKKILDPDGSNNPPSPQGGSGKKSVPPDRIQLPAVLKIPAFQDAWLQWVTYRREMGKKLTATGAAKTMRLFESWGPARAIAAIDHTIEKGWQGIAEPDGKGSDSPYGGIEEFLNGGEDE